MRVSLYTITLTVVNPCIHNGSCSGMETYPHAIFSANVRDDVVFRGNHDNAVLRGKDREAKLMMII